MADLVVGQQASTVFVNRYYLKVNRPEEVSGFRLDNNHVNNSIFRQEQNHE
jgi:hypothetical protein